MLFWFLLKYAIIFIFTKSFLKTVWRLSSKKLKDWMIGYWNVKEYVSWKRNPLEDISLFFVLKKTSVENLKINIELVFVFPKYSISYCLVLLILIGLLNHRDKLLLFISNLLFVTYYITSLSCSLCLYKSW